MDIATDLMIKASVLVVGLAIAAPFLIRSRRNARRLAQTYNILGNAPKSPKPITVDLDRDTAIKRFVQGLNSVQINQGWAIKDHGLQSGAVKAEMRLTAHQDKSARHHEYGTNLLEAFNSTNHYLVLNATFTSQGRGCLVAWKYDRPDNPFPKELTAPQYSSLQTPTAHQDCAATNLQILQALGVLDGNVPLLDA